MYTEYQPRFVPAKLVPDLLHAWRMTAVGWTVRPGTPAGIDPHTRYGRLCRAAAAFCADHPGVTTTTGAYKDLDCLLGPVPGRVNC